MEREVDVASGGKIVVGVSLGSSFDGREVVQSGDGHPLLIGRKKMNII
jgi:hypothetical protein